MDQLLTVINFDDVILKLMCQIKPIPTQWSQSFLEQCLSLINLIRHEQLKIKIIKQKKISIENKNSNANYLFNLTRYIFSHYDQFKEQIGQYLNSQQSEIIRESFDLGVVS